MADPLIDEAYMLEMLDTHPPAKDDVERLCAGAMMLLIDAFDRKVTRNNFAYAMDIAIKLHSYASQLAAIRNMQAALANGKLTDDVLKRSEQQCAALVAACTAGATKIATALTECPLSVDKVH